MPLIRKYDIKTFFTKKRQTLQDLYHCWDRRIPMKLVFLCDVDISILPAGTKIGHPYGICIQPNTIIGYNVDIRQGVTIGKRHMKNPVPELPAIIGNNVFLGANCTVLGPVKIGDNATIGAHALVLRDVPPETTVTGIWK